MDCIRQALSIMSIINMEHSPPTHQSTGSCLYPDAVFSDHSKRSTRTKKTTILQILNIPELCEHVLINLPPHDILIAQRTCRAIRLNVKSSPALQTKLFLRATRAEPQTWIAPSSTRLLTGTEAMDYLKECLPALEPHQLVQPRISNPLVLRKECRDFDKWPSNDACRKFILAWRIHKRVSIPDYCFEKFNIHRQVLCCDTGTSSCLDMFLTQPPVTKVGIVLSGEDVPALDKAVTKCGYVVGTITNAGGVTVRDIIDKIGHRDCGIECLSFPDDFVMLPEDRELMDTASNTTNNTRD